MTTIYVILENDEIRYIGKTKKADLKEKLDQHVEDANSNPEKFEWMGNLFKDGKRPEIRSVFTYQDHEAEYYDRLFISDYKFFSGLKLTSQLYFKPEIFYEKINKLKKSEIQNSR